MLLSGQWQRPVPLSARMSISSSSSQTPCTIAHLPPRSPSERRWCTGLAPYRDRMMSTSSFVSERCIMKGTPAESATRLTVRSVSGSQV